MSIYQQIQILLNQEKTQEALTVFAETASPESELLQSRYDRLLEAKALGKGSVEHWQIERNRIHFALLEFTKPETPPQSSSPDNDHSEQIRNLIAKGETEAALQLLLSMGKMEAEELLARLKASQKQFAMREIDYGSLNEVQADIAQKTLMLSQGKKGAEKSPSNPLPITQHTPPTIDPAQKMTLQQAAPKIRQELRDGNIDEAIYLLFQADISVANALYARFSEASRLNVLGLVDFGERSRMQTQIFNAILQSPEMQSTESFDTPDATEKAEILQLLQEQKTEKALERCQSYGDAYLLLHAQFSVAQKEWRKNLTASEYFEAIKSRINYSLLELMGQLPDSSIPSKSILSKFRNLFK
jgi:hypothetical protein